MPSPTSDRTETPRRKINPATCTREELCRHLGTDPAVGLSPKEAERRHMHSMATPLFGTVAPRFSMCLKRSFRDPVLWILLAVSLIALFFDRVPLGLVCLLLVGGHALVCAVLRYKAGQIDAAMQAYDAPLAHVLRSRRPRRIGAAGVVKGDILLLYPGDILPADCRLLRTERFSVSERELDATDDTRPLIRLEKDADAVPEATGSFRLSPVNMAFAGAIVEEGFAIAVAIAVGSETHLGGLIGTMSPAHGGRTPEAFKQGARGLSLYNLALLALLIPLIVIGILTLGDRYEFFDIFLSVTALAALGLSEHILAKGTYMAARIRRDAATDRDPTGRVDIKSTVETEKLTSVTDVLLVGTAALHDGLAHPATLHIGDAIYDCGKPEADRDACAVGELLYLYREGGAVLPLSDGPASRRLSEALRVLIPAFCAWAEVDAEELLVKCKDIRPERCGVSAIFPTAEGNRRVTVTVTDDLSGHPGVDVPDSLRRAARIAAQEGYHPLFILTGTADELVAGRGSARALLTYTPHTCQKTLGAIRSMEAAGIRVAAFLRTASEENTRILEDSGLTTEYAVYRPASDGPEVSAAVLLDEGVRAFEACTEAYIRAAIADLRAAGRTVAVLSADAEDLPLLSGADLAVTCAPSLYATAEEGIPHLSDQAPETRAVLGADGTSQSACATDLCRRRADVIVRRTSEAGGGLCGLRHAFLAADRVKDTLDGALLYLLFTQALRTLTVLLTLCMGLSAIPATVLMISGLFVDTLVVLAMARLPLGETPATRRILFINLPPMLLSLRPHLIALGVTTVVPWVLALIARLTGSDFGTGYAGYALLTLVGGQLAIFASARRRISGSSRTDRTSFFITFFLALAYIAALAAALASGLSLIRAIVYPVIAPLAYGITVQVIEHRRRRNSHP